jgi:PTH2 family peptidyl-tRNA hydrolase
MVLCVRTDLQMTKGKIAAQCGHASLGMYMKLQNREPTLLQNWFASGQPKIALKVESEADMLSLRSAATALQLPVHVVVDAGKTQLAPNTRTVLAILGPKESLDAVSGVLKLL